MAMEGMTLTGTTTIKDYDEHGQRRIEGFVDGREIVMVYESDGEWKVGSSSCLPTDIVQARRMVEVMSEVMERTTEYLTAEQLTEPGYYWWLPECFKDEPDNPEHWSVRNWHPKDSTRPRSGLFVGPIKAPVRRKDV